MSNIPTASSSGVSNSGKGSIHAKQAYISRWCEKEMEINISHLLTEPVCDKYWNIRIFSKEYWIFEYEYREL